METIMDEDPLWAAICSVGDDFTADQVDEAEALARLVDLGCTEAGAESHLARWKGSAPTAGDDHGS
jgi:hypothetical protein